MTPRVPWLRAVTEAFDPGTMPMVAGAYMYARDAPPEPPRTRRFDELGHGWLLAHPWRGEPAQLRHVGAPIVDLTRVRWPNSNNGQITLSCAGDLDEVAELLVAPLVFRVPPGRR